MNTSPCEQNSLFLHAQADLYFSIYLSRVVLKSRKMKSPGHYLPRDLLPSFVCSSNPGMAESCPFCLWVQAKERNLFSKITHKMPGLPETQFGGGQSNCVGILWTVSGLGALSFARHLLLPFAHLRVILYRLLPHAPACPLRLSLPAVPSDVRPTLLLL